MTSRAVPTSRPAWMARLDGMAATAAGRADRHLFRDLNPGQEYSPILDKAPSRARPASVLIPVIDRPAGPTVLFTIRTRTMPSHAGEISFPGGGPKDGDQNEVDTALREAEEEVTLTRSLVDPVCTLGEHYGGLGYRVTPVVGLVSGDAAPERCEREVAEIFEVPLDFIVDLDNHVVEGREFNDVPYRMFAVPYEEKGRVRHIWGLTAGILHTFAHAWHDLPLPVADQ